MKTYYAPPERAKEKELAAEIEVVSSNPVTSGLLHSISGLMAILDQHRQVVAINDSFLHMLGIEDPKEALGLRLGEMLHCVHAGKGPAGCGTTEFCSTCGAAIAIVSSLNEKSSSERLCALSAVRDDKSIDLILLVKAQPIIIDGKKFILVFLRDVTQQEQQAALERTFYHDINNMLNMLVQASQLLVHDQPSELAEIIHHSALHLSQEVAIQRCLSQSDIDNYQPMWDQFTTEKILNELQLIFENHPAANEKSIEFIKPHPPGTIKTDIFLLLRVLCNMIINALEASEKGDRIKVWTEKEKASQSFCVWNRAWIPPHIARRLFQRNFTTKVQAGRGLGTYSMKLFGERILGGKLKFESSKEEGTVFTIVLPLS